MSDQSSIFDNNQNQGNQPIQNNSSPSNGGAPSNQDELVTLLSGIKNEKGEPKYKTVQDALKALAHSQAFIPQLTAENEAIKNQLAATQAAADKVKQLEEAVLQLTQNNNSQVNQPQGLSEEAIAALVSSQLTKVQQDQVMKTNLDSVVGAMTSTFGDKAEEVFYAKAKELGMTVAEINTLAARTPKAALNLLGLSASQTQNRSTPNNGINTAGFQPRQDTAVGFNTKPIMLGATTHELLAESANAKKMVEELHADGKTTYDLTDPKIYFKYFNK